MYTPIMYYNLIYYICYISCDIYYDVLLMTAVNLEDLRQCRSINQGSQGYGLSIPRISYLVPRRFLLCCF